MFHRRSWQELVKHTETICRQIAKEFFQHHTKWSNTLKQFAVKLPANVLSVVDHFVGFTEFSRAFWVPLNAHFLNDKLTQVMLYCALIAYIYFGNVRDFWKCKSIIYIEIFYKNYVNKNCGAQNLFLYFFQFPKIFVLWFFSWWWWSNKTTWAILMYNLSSSFYWWDVIGRLNLETAYSFNVKS